MQKGAQYQAVLELISEIFKKFSEEIFYCALQDTNKLSTIISDLIEEKYKAIT